MRTARCVYCDAPGGTVDHVIPLSRGGQHAEGNLVPACKSCNSSKGDKLLIEWLLVKRANAMR
nr:HNH endonuclease [Streptomyces sp. SID8499]